MAAVLTKNSRTILLSTLIAMIVVPNAVFGVKDVIKTIN
jgi:hypothetical protein